MKNILLSLALILSFFFVNAQIAVEGPQNFTAVPTGWTSSIWSNTSQTASASTGYTGASGGRYYNIANNGNVSNYLLSDPIDLSGLQSAKLSFGVAKSAVGFTQSILVEVYNGTSTASYTIPNSALATTWSLYNIDLGSTVDNKTGVTVRISKPASTAGTAYFKLDDFTLNACPISLSQPVNLAVDPVSCSTLALSWDAVTNATAYTVERATNIDFTSGFVSTSVANNSFLATGLSTGTAYYFRIKATCGTCSTTSVYSEIQSAKPLVPSPNNFAATVASCSQINLSWTAATNYGTPSYIVDRASNNSFSAGLVSTTVTTSSLAVTGLNLQSTYYFRIRTKISACAAPDNVSDYSTTLFATTSGADGNCYCAASGPGNSSDYVANVSLANLNNSTAGSASGYTFYASPIVNVNAGCSYSLSLQGSFSGDYYRVWIDYNQNGTFDPTESVFGGAFGSSPFVSSTTITISPTAVIGNTRMRVIVSFNTVPSTAACVSLGSGGEVEDYIVQIGGAYTGAPSTAPVAKAATGFSCNNFIANWNAVADANNYFLDVSLNPGFTSFVAGFNNKSVGDFTSCYVSGLSANTAYYYRVRASNCAGSNAANSNTISASTNATCYCAVVGDGSSARYIANVTLDGINNTTGNTAYQLYSSPIGSLNIGCGYNISLTDNFSGDYYRVWIDYNQDGDFVDAGELVFSGTFSGSTASGNFAIPGTALAGSTRMRVMLTFPSGTPDPCVSPNFGEIEDYLLNINTVGTSPASPATKAATIKSCSSFDANWTGSSAAIGYYLDVAYDSSFLLPVGSYTNVNVGNVNTYPISGIAPGTYYYRVRAEGCGGISPSSALQTVTLTYGSAKVYVGPLFGYWNNKSNWSPSGIPSICDDVVIPIGNTVYVQENVNAVCNNLNNAGYLLEEMHIVPPILATTRFCSITVYGNLINSGVIKSYTTGYGLIILENINRFRITVYGTTNNSGQFGSNTDQETLDEVNLIGDITNSGTIHTDGVQFVVFTNAVYANYYGGNLSNTLSGTLRHNLSTNNYTITTRKSITNAGTVLFSSGEDYNVGEDLTNNLLINHSGNGVFYLSGASKNINSGLMANYSKNTKITIANGASYTVNNSLVLYKTTINNSGVLNLKSASSVILNTNIFTQNGTINLNDARLEIEEANPTMDETKFNYGTSTTCFCSGYQYAALSQTLPAPFTFYNLHIGKLLVPTTAQGQSDRYTINSDFYNYGSFSNANNSIYNINGNFYNMAGTVNANSSITNLLGHWTNNSIYNGNTSTVKMLGNSTQNIGGSAITTFQNLLINQTAAGKVVLNQHIKVNDVLTLTNGGLNLNQKSAEILTVGNPASVVRTNGYVVSEDNADNGFGKASNLSRFIWNIGANTNTYTFPFGMGTGLSPAYYIPFIFTRPAGGGDLGKISVGTYHASVIGSPATVGPWPSPVNKIAGLVASNNTPFLVTRFWEIDKTGGDLNFLANVTFTYADTELPSDQTGGSTKEAGLRAQRWDNVDQNWWKAVPGSAFPNTAGSSALTQSNNELLNTVSAVGISKFSPWALAKSISPLPIELLSFTAKAKDNTVVVSWKKAGSYRPLAANIIEKSIDGIHYSIIDSSVVEAGSSYKQNGEYQVVDKNPSTGVNYYRLRENTVDGEHLIYKPAVLKFGFENAFATVQIWPNPASDFISIKLKDQAVNNLKFTITDISAKEVLKGEFSERINISSLSAGSYVLKLEDADGSSTQVHFIKN